MAMGFVANDGKDTVKDVYSRMNVPVLVQIGESG
jgi:hypothetical protein